MRRDGRWRRTGAVALAALLVAACSGGGDDAEPVEEDPPLRHVVVALGDSFTSGEGAPPYDADPASCRRAADAWPRLLAEVAVVASVELRACAGARTEHLTGSWDRRDLGPQIPDEPDPEATLVLLTVGGNDIGFGEIVATCVLLTCSPEPDDDGFRERLDELREDLVQDVHPALAAAYPNARIVHVSYPRLTPPTEVEPSTCRWMSDDDQRISRAIVDAINDAAEDAAQQAGTAEHLDVADALAGHELCTEDGWVNGVGFDPGDAHPNLGGQRGMARAVAEALELPKRS